MIKKSWNQVEKSKPIKNITDKITLLLVLWEAQMMLLKKLQWLFKLFVLWFHWLSLYHTWQWLITVVTRLHCCYFVGLKLKKKLHWGKAADCCSNSCKDSNFQSCWKKWSWKAFILTRPQMEAPEKRAVTINHPGRCSPFFFLEVFTAQFWTRCELLHSTLWMRVVAGENKDCTVAHVPEVNPAANYKTASEHLPAGLRHWCLSQKPGQNYLFFSWMCWITANTFYKYYAFLRYLSLF